jgi:putative transposase
VSRKRVLQLMRTYQLLSPYLGRQGEPRAHDGTIITDAPNLMWGTDGTKVFTLDDEWVCVFAAVEHWNAECVGWYVSKHGDRYAALEPISQGLTSLYGSVTADVTRRLLLRMDHGSQYLSDHFVNQVRFWGIKPSFAFMEKPLTNSSTEPSRSRRSAGRSSETSKRSVVR